MLPSLTFQDTAMIKFNIPDMSCGHCAGVITKAVKSLDQDAALDFDLAAHTLQVRTSADLHTLLATLDDAGYPATHA